MKEKKLFQTGKSASKHFLEMAEGGKIENEDEAKKNRSWKDERSNKEKIASQTEELGSKLLKFLARS